jgi:hypothetical protein
MIIIKHKAWFASVAFLVVLTSGTGGGTVFTLGFFFVGVGRTLGEALVLIKQGRRLAFIASVFGGGTVEAGLICTGETLSIGLVSAERTRGKAFSFK